MRLGLDRMRAILSHLGQPHQALRCVHIAGTNGKGSTAVMVAEIARAAGLRVGLYTSPHLVRFHERIVVDGQPIRPEELAEAFEAVHAAVQAVAPEEPPTQFEFATAMALWHLARCRVDLAVVEVGLGGRLDATNVVVPELAVVTPVDLDHTQVLGGSLAEVAWEKAGILKPGVPVVLAPQLPPALDVLARRARELGCPLYRVVEATGCQNSRTDGGGERPPWWSFRFAPAELTLSGSRFDLTGPDGLAWGGLYVGLAGHHQVQNAATAAAVAWVLSERGWPLDEGAVRAGLRSPPWEARLQVLRRDPLVLLDGAHNPAAARAVGTSLKALLGRLPRVLVLGMLAEKDVEGILRELVTPGSMVIATRARSSRSPAVDPASLAALAVARGAAAAVAVEPPGAAVRLAVEAGRRWGPVLVAGSLYLAGEVLASRDGWQGSTNPSDKLRAEPQA